MSRQNRVLSLMSHGERYVSVAQLAAYWHVSAKQIYKQIEAGTLPAVRLGPRLFRIRTEVALAFEHRAQMMVTRDAMDMSSAHGERLS